MSRYTYDTESDGLFEEATVIWCIVLKDIDNNNIQRFSRDNVDYGIKLLEQADELICHNQIDHDLRLIKKLYPSWSTRAKIMDTMLLSQLLQPDRAGGHSLQAAGERYGRYKPEHEDWSKFSPEMLHRCSEDVEINTWWYHELMEECYEDIEGVPYEKVFTGSI